MEVWQTVLLAVGSNTVLVTVLAWIARALLTNSLSKDLERHRASLALENQSATERLRHDLALIAQEHQISFSELQGRRANVIAETYSLIAKAHMECAKYVSSQDWTGQTSQQDQYIATQNAMGQFYTYFNCNRIFIPEQTAATIDKLVRGMHYQVDRLHGYMSYGTQSSNRTVTKVQLDACSEASEHFNKLVPQARAELENDLRAIVGDPTVRVAS